MTSRRRTAARQAGKVPTLAQARAFLRREGMVLVSARGAVPSLAEYVAGGPIRGSWWGHPRGNAIFRVLNGIAESPDVRMFRLLGGKITLVHQRLWPALVRVAAHLPAGALDAVTQEHTERGRHRAVATAYPCWVRADVHKAAALLTEDEAWTLLPSALRSENESNPKAPRRRHRARERGASIS